MTTLADFLLARIAEDEAVARAATQGNERYPRWTAEPNMRVESGCRCLTCEEPSGSWDVYPIDGPDCDMHGCFHTMTIGEADAKHIARHDPARVLAECEAKRQIIEDAKPWADEACRYGRCAHQVGDADGGETHWRGVQGWCTLASLALPYADHPDYRQEWAL